MGLFSISEKNVQPPARFFRMLGNYTLKSMVSKFPKLKKSNVLYFPGCIAYFKDRREFELWKNIFLKLGINFKLVEKKVCCGLYALQAGYDYEARKLARKNLEIFKEEKVEKIIVPCPACYKMFTQDYKNYLPDWNIETLNIWKTILEKIRKKPELIKNKINEEIGFVDSCYLGRYSDIYEEPRQILELIGYKIKEFKDNKESSMCSGSCGGLVITNHSIANKSAKEKLLQAKRIGIKKLLVCSYEEYELLKRNSTETGIEILFFSEVLGNSLGIKKTGII